MNPEESLDRPERSPRSTHEVAQQLRQNDQAAVRPTAPLDQERTKIGWRRAKGEPFGIVVEPPALVDQVDAGFRVLDYGSVLNVDLDREAALHLSDDDVFEGRLAQERIGAYPVGRAIAREALVNQVLDVGSGSGDILGRAEPRRERAVKGRWNGDARRASVE